MSPSPVPELSASVKERQPAKRETRELTVAMGISPLAAIESPR